MGDKFIEGKSVKQGCSQQPCWRFQDADSATKFSVPTLRNSITTIHMLRY
jgi:hypothetical protein